MEENLPDPGRHRLLEEAQELLMARRSALRLAREGNNDSPPSCDPVDPPHPGQRKTEDWKRKTENGLQPTAGNQQVLEAVAGLPDHLGWGSARQTTVLRAAAKRRSKNCQPAKNGALAALKERRPARAPQQSAGAQQHICAAGAVSLSPSLGLAILRHKQAANGRLWLLLRAVDADGRGAIPLTTARKLFTDQDSPLRFCGQRQLRNLLAAGEGLFWQVDDKQIWLRSAVRVAQALGVSHFGGQDVAVPLTALTGGISRVRANLFASFHSGRASKPVARQTLARKSGIAPRTQRQYDRLSGVNKQSNYARGPRLGSNEAQEQAWQQGPAAFAWQEKRKQREGRKNRFLAWQLPNSYHGPHARMGRGRQKRQNRTLADLLNKGTAGNDQGQYDDLTARYFADARTASSAFGRKNTPVYWPDTKPGLWHCHWPQRTSGPAS